jgi:hypothetical protein
VSVTEPAIVRSVRVRSLAFTGVRLPHFGHGLPVGFSSGIRPATLNDWRNKLSDNLRNSSKEVMNPRGVRVISNITRAEARELSIIFDRITTTSEQRMVHKQLPRPHHATTLPRLDLPAGLPSRSYLPPLT